ncbi:ATP-dependent RecD-like DNA helicase [Sunxiuqinia elliptica]|uniref:Exodeoxyribonuclease-5 n=1 Tax=Sunxiuqinia elliptica TaxID=655355 RepID=A0A4R6GPI8_9BACT|nr:AAA family ATPase [Sunxiuqinia elliptica]TDN97202.1 exodeoxyribonuclease-5 [Sunxiuqinia elliptica]TDO60614.1 exodeoxyribonuclease-5 [Sunxiuqinia elliptica]
MLKKHIQEQIYQNLGFTPTEGQKQLTEKLAAFVVNADPDVLFLLKGYAGTGKTSMLNALVKTLHAFKFQTVLLAPTGRAAKVLSSYTGQSAYTVHKKIYRQKSTTDGFGQFVLDKNLTKDCFFIVDEASMIANSSNEGSVFGTGRLLDDLYEFVYTGKNCKLILVGDTAQLPPVGMEISPALDVSELEMYGATVDHHELVDVVRQEQNSGILYNATEIRSLIGEGYFFPDYFPIETESFSDIKRIGGGELIEKISDCYDKYGEEETIVITRSNKRANKFNEGIRSTILYKEAQVTVGDLLMVVKNNYFWLGEDEKVDFIANGDIVEIQSIYSYEELYGFHFANVCLKFVDYDDLEIDCKILLETLSIETASLGYEDSQRLFQSVAEDYQDIRSKKKRWEKIRENEHFNALQVKFAYAVTCHKAQGGQWNAVFVDQGYLVEDMLNVEYLRWLYTAFTRPVKELYLVNFNKEFFGE